MPVGRLKLSLHASPDHWPITGAGKPWKVWKGQGRAGEEGEEWGEEAARCRNSDNGTHQILFLLPSCPFSILSLVTVKSLVQVRGVPLLNERLMKGLAI